MFKKLVSCTSILSLLSVDVACCFTDDEGEESSHSISLRSSSMSLESEEKDEETKAFKQIDIEDLLKTFSNTTDPQKKLEIFKQIPQQGRTKEITLKIALGLISSQDTPREIQLGTLRVLAEKHMSPVSQTPDLEKKPFIPFVLSFVSDHRLSIEERANLLHLLDKENLIKLAKKLLEETKNPSDIIKITSALPREGNAEDELRIQCLLPIIQSEKTPNPLKALALLCLPYDKLDKELRKKLDESVLPCIDDEEVSFDKRVNLVFWLTQQLPTKSLLSLLNVVDIESNTTKQKDSSEKFVKTENCINIFAYATTHKATEIQKKVEELFFTFPDALSSYAALPWLDTYLQKAEEPQKTTFIKKLHQFFLQKKVASLSHLERRMSTHLIGLANLILMTTSSPELVGPAEDFLKQLLEGYKIQELDNDSSSNSEDEDLLYFQADVYKACRVILQHSKNQELRDNTFNWIVKIGEHKFSPETFGRQCGILRVLLKQEDKQSRGKGLELIRAKLNAIDPKLPEVQKGLTLLYKALRKSKQGEKEQQQILDLLKPIFLEIISPNMSKEELSDTESENSSSSEGDHDYNIVALFLMAADQEFQKQAYAYMKNMLVGTGLVEEDNPDLDELENICEQTIDAIIEAFGEEHPFSQEAIQIMAGHANKKNPHSIFAVHHRLMEKIKEPVKHIQIPTKPIEGRRFQLNLKKINSPLEVREVHFVRHKDFVELVQQLADEVYKSYQEQEKKEGTQPYGGAYGMFLNQMGTLTTDYLMGKAKESFFGFLLDSDTATSPDKNASELSCIFRNVLNVAQQKDKQFSSEGLSPSSSLVLQLLVNVLTCPTGREGGVRNAELLIQELPTLSEEEIDKKVTDLATDFILKDLRTDKRWLLNGEGRLVRKLLDKENHEKIDEPPHQGKYLLSLVGDEIGLRSKGERVPFDVNGTAVSQDLQKFSKQDVLDIFYALFTPESVIKKYLEKFNKRDFKIVKTGPRPEDEKDVSYGVIKQLMGVDNLMNPNYAYFDEDAEDYTTLYYTPLLMTEVLTKLGILEEVKEE